MLAPLHQKVVTGASTEDTNLSLGGDGIWRVN